MTSACTALYQTQHIRVCEHMAINILGLSEEELMVKAGVCAFSTLKKWFPKVRTLAVFCGSGNNGGDGYVLARLAFEEGYKVVINQYKSPEDLPPAAREAALQAQIAGVPCQDLDDPIDVDAELIVDALLGIGLAGKVHGPLAAAINQINEANLPILALDIPSGLQADTGRVLGNAIKADVTVTFIAQKIGLQTADGVDHCGELVCHSLQLESCLSGIEPAAYLISDHLLEKYLFPRLKNSHKGLFGHVLVVGGNEGMPGAVILAAQAAMRVGAGMVTIATTPAHAQQALPLLPEAMIYGVEQGKDLRPLLEKASVCLIGPGLGEDAWAQALFALALTSQLPMVIDASALHLLAKNSQRDDNWILTPHPGEAALLLNTTAKAVCDDRYQAVSKLQEQYGGNVILKGAGTLIRTDERSTYLCPLGNPGMASAGMGDTLSGVLAGLIAQGLRLTEAAQLGVWLHAYAGDLAAEKRGERGMLASDLLPYLQRLVNP